MKIAFTGHKLVGKSTAADYCCDILRQEYDEVGHVLDSVGLVRIAAIQAIEMLDLNPPRKHFFHHKTPESRKLLQALGNYARSLDKDILVKHVKNQIKSLKGRGHHFFNENMRMLREADMYREMGFVVVRITRPGFTGDDDVTETEMDKIAADYTITNDRGLGELKQNVAALIRKFHAASSAEVKS